MGSSNVDLRCAKLGSERTGGPSLKCSEHNISIRTGGNYEVLIEFRRWNMVRIEETWQCFHGRPVSGVARNSMSRVRNSSRSVISIPDAINNHGRPMTLLELIDALPINKKKSDGIHRLMRMLVHWGYFVEKESPKNGQELGYWLTPASRLFLKDEPLCVTPFL
ncbi:hypothetical protein LguiA_022479 [Lonicera macranthoides]